MDSIDRHDTVRLSPNDRDLCIRLLGEFSVSRNGQSVKGPAWRFRNASRLVQMLALAPGHRMHREQVIEWFWPESDTQQTSNRLHQVLHHTRRALKMIGCDRSTLQLQRGVISLQVPDDGGIWIDVDAFETTARSARQHDGLDYVLAALSLYPGELLPEERYAEWTIQRRDALENDYLALVLQSGTAHEASGDLAGAGEAYTLLLRGDPASEEGHAGLMRVLALSGRRQQALSQYQQLEELSLREYGSGPSDEVMHLRDRIEQGTFADGVVSVAERLQRHDRDEPAFVGREQELRVLKDAVERSFSGSGRVLMLSGEPGVGKTRTARELAESARRSGAIILWGNCYQDEGTPAYWPWVQIIREALSGLDVDAVRYLMGSGAGDIARIVPEVRECLHVPPAAMVPGVAQARFQVFDSMTRFLKQLSLRKPLLIVLDDLHWSDSSTLLLLAFLAREIDRSRIVVLGTFRDAEAEAGHPLTLALAEMNRSLTLQRLPLGGLSEADVRKLAEVSFRLPPGGGVTELVLRRTDGNPLFVGEMLRMIRDETASDPAAQNWQTSVPQGVNDVIAYRLSQLSPVCVDVLSAGAALGREFTVHMLGLATDTTRAEVLDVLDEAARTQIVQDAPNVEGTYRFFHELMQDAVYTRIPSAKRTVLHRRIGEAIETLHSGDPDRHLTELAYHFSRAALDGQIQPAIEYGVRAGDQALTRVAYGEAIDHYRRALATVEAHDPRAHTAMLDVLIRLGDAQNHIGDRSDAMETFGRAIGIARMLDNPTDFARAVLGYCGLGLFTTSLSNVPLLEEAIEMLPALDSALRARLLARLAFELYDVAPVEHRQALSDLAVGIARRISDPATLIYVLIARNWTVETLDNLGERVSITGEVLEIVHRSEEVVLAPTAHAMGFYDGFYIGNLRTIEQQLSVFEELAEKSREPQRRWLTLIFKLTRATLQGCFDEADRWLDEASQVARSALTPIVHERRVFSHLVEIRREQGRIDEIGDVPVQATGTSGADLYWRALALHVQDARDPEAVMAQDILELVSDIQALDLDTLAAVALLSTLQCVAVRPELATRLLDFLDPYRDQYIFARITHQPYGSAAYYSGRLAARLGRLVEAEAHLRLAISMNEQVQARPYLARSQLELAKVLRSTGAPDDCAKSCWQLESATMLAHQVGMPVLLAEVRDEQLRLASSQGGDCLLPDSVRDPDA